MAPDLTPKAGPGTDKFSVFWYNVPEIFNFTEADFDAKASQFAAAGVNIVMTFSCTHFRWSFKPWHDLILNALAKLTRASHRYGIRVVEHSSSHLTHDPRTAEEWRRTEHILGVRHCSFEDFPGLRDFMSHDAYQSYRQIDGRTGTEAKTSYAGFGMCFNNPNYRKAYFDYLTQVFQVADVDGIMADDVQFFGDGHACTCVHCRRLFRECTGYELPNPEHWSEFFGHYENPAFIAWLHFRIDSTADFQRAVSAHLKTLKPNILRPNYCAIALSKNYSAYAFEAPAELWTTFFQENMFSCVIRASWLLFANEAVHRYAMARNHNVNAMSMFYPMRRDDYYFSWALTRLWGELLMATPEGGDIAAIEVEFADFERRYQAWTLRPQKLADCAFFHPRESLDYTEDSIEKVNRPLAGWLQGAALANVTADMVLASEPLEQWQKFPMIVFVGALMLDDVVLDKVQAYVCSGGHAVIFEEFASLKPDGSRRNPGEVADALGGAAELKAQTAIGSAVFRYHDATVRLIGNVSAISITPGARDEVIIKTENGTVLGVTGVCGAGRVTRIGGGVLSHGEHASQIMPPVSRLGDAAPPQPAWPRVAERLRDEQGAMLKALLHPLRESVAVSAATGYLAAAYRVACGFVVHLVNVAHTLPETGDLVSHDDLLSDFLPGAQPNACGFTVVFRRPCDSKLAAQATLLTPEMPREQYLPIEVDGRLVKTAIPAGAFSGYAMLAFAEAVD